MARLGLAFACVPTAMGLAARWNWFFDLGSHFVVQSAVATLLFAVLFAAWRDWRACGAAMIVCLFNAARIVPLYLAAPPVVGDSGATATIRVLAANVHSANREASAFLDLVKREDPDIVVALEIDARWERELQPLKDRYPHSVVEARSDNFGIAFFTRLESEAIDIVELGRSEIPTVVARLRINGRIVEVIGTHPLPPTSRENTTLRNDQLREIAQRANDAPDGAIVAGDLNITSWSPPFQDLLREGGLRDSRVGFGIQTTWPTTSPLLRIPIDHVLASPEFRVTSRRVGDDIGSDHLPVVVDLAVPTSRVPGAD